MADKEGKPAVNRTSLTKIVWSRMFSGIRAAGSLQREESIIVAVENVSMVLKKSRDIKVPQQV